MEVNKVRKKSKVKMEGKKCYMKTSTREEGNDEGKLCGSEGKTEVRHHVQREKKGREKKGKKRKRKRKRERERERREDTCKVMII